MQIKISLPDDVIASIDEARGDVSRSIYVRRALEANEMRVAQQVDVSSPVRVRRSPKLRSGITPRPKGKA